MRREPSSSLDSTTGRRLWSSAPVRPDEDTRLDYFRLPVVASYSWTLAVFVGALAVFHAALVWAWPLGRVGWKRIDYVWLLFGMIGVLSGVQAVRQELADGLLPEAEEFARFEGTAILDRIGAGASPAICRTLEPFEPAPRDGDVERRQREFDEVCAWFRAAKQRVAGGLPAERPLTLERLGGDPVPLGTEFSIVAGLEDAVARYNRAQDTLERLTRDADQSDAEATLAAVGPFLIAIALALRITKVTGEIRLERRG